MSSPPNDPTITPAATSTTAPAATPPAPRRKTSPFDVEIDPTDKHGAKLIEIGQEKLKTSFDGTIKTLSRFLNDLKVQEVPRPLAEHQEQRA